MKDSDTMHNYISSVLEIVNQIRSYGDDLSDQRVVEKILRSLPMKYDHVVAAIEESKDTTLLSVDELLRSFQSHEERLNRSQGNSVENAFHTKLNFSKEKGNPGIGDSKENNKYSSSRVRGGRWSRGRRGGGRSGDHHQRNCDGNDKSEIRKPQCYYCKRFGHIERFCRLKEKQAKFVVKKEEQGNVKQENESLFLACFYAKECSKHVWYVDSGCSNHMTGG